MKGRSLYSAAGGMFWHIKGMVHKAALPLHRARYALLPSLSGHDNRMACGLIGAGAVFRGAYAPAFNAPDCPMLCKAVYTPRAESATAAARHLRYPVRVFTDLEHFLESGLDCVIILSPNDTHFHYASLAAERGLHVFCEKPLCSKSEDIRTLQRTVHRHGICLTVGYGLRFDPRLRDTGRIIREGTIGAPLSLHVRHELNIVKEITGSPWLIDCGRVGGGVLHHFGTHMINLLCSWFGRPVEVSARMWNETLPEKSGEDHASCVLRFPDGITATLGTSSDSTILPPAFASITAMGGCGILSSTYKPCSIQLDVDGQWRTLTRYTHSSGGFLALAQMHHFVFCVRNKTIPETDIEDAFRTQECIERCYAAAGMSTG